MDNILLIIEKFEGIIGALLGVIITMIMNEYLKSKGKIKFYFDNYKTRYMGRNEECCYAEVEVEEEYETFEYDFNMQLLNTSENKKILRDIKLQFQIQGIVFESTPKDKDTNRRYAGGYKSDEINIINLKPKEITDIKVEGYISKREMDIIQLKDIDKVYFVAKDGNDKTVKKIIKDFTRTS